MPSSQAERLSGNADAAPHEVPPPVHSHFQGNYRSDRKTAAGPHCECEYMYQTFSCTWRRKIVQCTIPSATVLDDVLASHEFSISSSHLSTLPSSPPPCPLSPSPTDVRCPSVCAVSEPGVVGAGGDREGEGCHEPYHGLLCS